MPTSALLGARDVILLHRCAAGSFFGGVGALFEAPDAVFLGGSQAFLWLLASNGGTEECKYYPQNQDAYAYGVHRSGSWLGLSI
jgi:hypothetical protein